MVEELVAFCSSVFLEPQEEKIKEHTNIIPNITADFVMLMVD